MNSSFGLQGNAKVTTEDDGGAEFYNVRLNDNLTKLRNFFNGNYNEYIASQNQGQGELFEYVIGSIQNNIYCSGEEWFNCDANYPIFFQTHHIFTGMDAVSFSVRVSSQLILRETQSQRSMGAAL